MAKIVKEKNMKILIVDDDPVKADLIKKSLNYTNAEITVINNGKDALMDILIEDYDYMVSDMQFPWSGSEIEDTCGIHLQQELADSEIDLKTVICSSVKRNADFKNVIGYIIYQGHDLEDRFKLYIR